MSKAPEQHSHTIWTLIQLVTKPPQTQISLAPPIYHAHHNHHNTHFLRFTDKTSAWLEAQITQDKKKKSLGTKQETSLNPLGRLQQTQ